MVVVTHNSVYELCAFSRRIRKAGSESWQSYNFVVPPQVGNQLMVHMPGKRYLKTSPIQQLYGPF